jgi:outer membrane protein assembly factor BamB
VVDALDAQTGKLTWKFQTGGNAPTPPLPSGAALTLAGGDLYVGAQGGIVYALDATTGAVHWQRTVDSAVNSAPAFVAGTLYAASNNGTVYALRASDGALAWTTATGGTIFAAPAIAP